mgnify:CR=1 FL=1
MKLVPLGNKIVLKQLEAEETTNPVLFAGQAKENRRKQKLSL